MTETAVEAGERQLAELQGQLTEAEAAVKASAAAARDSLSRWHGVLSTALPVPEGVDAMAAELEAVSRAEQHVEAVLGLQQVVAGLEAVVREMAELDAQDPQLLELAAHAIDLCAEAASHSAAAAPLLTWEPGAAPQPLLDFARSVDDRIQAALSMLRSTLCSALAEGLEGAGWPPPLSSSGGPAAPDVLAAAPPPVLQLLRELAAYLTEAQRHIEAESFAAIQGSPAEGSPPLWLAEVLTEPLRQRLVFHFASGQETDRVDKPEWMLGYALRMAREMAPQTAALHTALQACGLLAHYALPVEVVGALRRAVGGIVGSHFLPNLLDMASPPLWLHLVDELCDFESQLAPLRGEMDEEEQVLMGPPLWAPGGVLSALVEEPSAMAAWERAELLAAQREVDAAGDGEAAWELGSAAGDGGDPAWQSEFRCPALGEAALEVLQALLRRAASLPTEAASTRFCRHVVVPVAANLLSSLSRLGQRAENYKDLSSETWAPKVGGACCAAHYLEHHVRELSAALLPPGSQPVLEGVAADLAAFHHKWSLKLAASVTQRLMLAAAPYKSSLADFEDERGDGGAAEENSGGAEVSRKWRPALHYLEDALMRLAGVLDAVVFRQTWRAVAAAINQILYNDIATEAQFSWDGAKRFHADCQALVSLFRPYTPRPFAHFKELWEACQLLVLPEDDVAAVEEAVEGVAEGGPAARRAAKAELLRYGVKSLEPEQAEYVLAQRL
mmetsp:Transcript_2464/g.6228  ORF Transcript_2464/g.6228 Transcript_2464/m.6228 type:complete len:730 (-) Transcript_2464:212-2401(-)